MKVLLISHPSINTHNNMGKTMLSLIHAFKKEDVCQLYIYPMRPDIDKCSSFYRITDKDVLKSCYKFRVLGKEIIPNDEDLSNHCLFENDVDRKIYKNANNRKPIRMLARDLMWKFANWFNKGLKNWIEKEKPECIFLAPGYQTFIYNIALKISKKYNIPIITYICDDYYFVAPPTSLLGKIHQYRLNKIINKLMNRTSLVITICDELAVSYNKEFGVETKTVMTGSNYQIKENCQTAENVSSITYMGNIGLKRNYALAQIGTALDEINEEFDTSYSLNIYSGEQNASVLSVFNGIKSINLCGFVSGKEFEKVMNSAEVLLHVESFDEDAVDLVKNSISTKIGDCLGSGICLFAYGPNNVASINYLLKNEVAIVCSDKSKLKDKLLFLFNDKKQREYSIQNALKIAKLNHDANVVGKTVYNLVDKVLKI